MSDNLRALVIWVICTLCAAGLTLVILEIIDDLNLDQKPKIERRQEF